MPVGKSDIDLLAGLLQSRSNDLVHVIVLVLSEAATEEHVGCVVCDLTVLPVNRVVLLVAYRIVGN